MKADKTFVHSLVDLLHTNMVRLSA